MRKTGILLMVLAGVMAAQQTTDQQQQQQPQTPAGQPPPSMQQGVQEPLPAPPPQVKVRETNLVEKIQAPSESDVYCGGFISSQSVPETSFVVAGWDTPHQTRFVEPDYIYAQGGGFAEGSDYLIVRKLRDPNRWEAYRGQHGAIAAAGQPYADIGQVSVVKGGVRGDKAILAVKRTCEPIVPGDYVIPFENRPRPELKYTGAFDPFAPPSGKLTGRIISARDFDQVIGTGKAVYLNVGSDQGVKVGDYFHATRTYGQLASDPADSLSFKATTTEDTQAHNVTFPKRRLNELPRRSLGEMIVIGVHPKSATAMMTFALEDVKVGDGVEAFEPPPPPPPPAPPAPTTPSISCTASPESVHKGESSTVTCQAASPDNHPISISFATTAGNVTPRDNTALLDTAQIAAPATVTVTGTVTDDRNQTASSAANVNVEAAAAPPAPTSQSITFKRGSAYVDNRAKAVLDGVALQLTQQADATAVVVGHSDKGEAKSLAARRAANVKTYLSSAKGIDPKRIETRTSTTPGKTAEVWVVPAGATVPAEAPPAEQPPPPSTPPQ
jgi:outer membrane protein OmpA-like peptidoglycan-associated protein